MERIGEYFVRRLVGEGGMGKVYEAEERLSRRRVALKVLRAELGRSEEGRQMFISEMSILAHLDHPNIVRSLSCSEVDGELVMALEFLEGETLRSGWRRAGGCPGRRRSRSPRRWRRRSAPRTGRSRPSCTATSSRRT